MTDFGPTPSSFPPTPPPPMPPSSRSGPPWEGTDGPPLQRWIDTAKGVLLDPMTTFTNMRREGGLGAPLAYYLIGLAVSVAAALLWHLVGFGAAMPGMFGGGGRAMAGAAMGLGFILVFLPLCQIVGLFIGTAIIHVLLMLFGGQKYGFETTFRAITYTQGSVAPLAIVPMCGSLIAAVWAIVCLVIGLAQMHETTTGKAAAAVLVPIVLCCGLIFLFGAAIATMAGFAAAGAAHGIQ
jgi:hypothetical protein